MAGQDFVRQLDEDHGFARTLDWSEKYHIDFF